MLIKKQPITIIASEESYINLTTFEDITQLNDTVRYYKDTFASELKKNTIKVLNLLHRYSAKYKGVSFLTKNNIAKQLEISRRTVIRACQLLEQLEIIKQYETKRKSDMQQTSNIIVIQPIKKDDDNSNGTQDDTQATSKNKGNCHTRKTTASLKQFNINTRKHNEKSIIQQLDNQKLDHSHVSRNIPKKLINAIKPFFPFASDIYAIYRRLTQATNLSMTSLYDNLDTYIQTFKDTLYKLKTGHVEGDYFGYLYGAFKRTKQQLDNTYIIPDDSIYFDFLDAD